ncbi:hypothetical protein QAD02_019843 [Eretmocerus hayati]|uniref:Uncharacterized protein n=1 Tax=Eretmocerus hayati TaxID=131215 RepID=A0ACC2PKR8_9HYME|nr:hypothetical protein QAD02_019843 [Eretmocerus hayati]
MDLIEVLWKQDVDLGFTLVEPTSAAKNTATSTSKESEDDIEKLKTLEAINAGDDKLEQQLLEILFSALGSIAIEPEIEPEIDWAWIKMYHRIFISDVTYRFEYSPSVGITVTLPRPLNSLHRHV